MSGLSKVPQSALSARKTRKRGKGDPTGSGFLPFPCPSPRHRQKKKKKQREKGPLWGVFFSSFLRGGRGWSRTPLGGDTLTTTQLLRANLSTTCSIFCFLSVGPPHPLWPVPLPKKKKLILAWMNADVVISPRLLVLVFVTFSCKRMANVLQILQHKEIKKQKKIHDAPSTNNNTPCPPRFLAWYFIVREG